MIPVAVDFDAGRLIPVPVDFDAGRLIPVAVDFDAGRLIPVAVDFDAGRLIPVAVDFDAGRLIYDTLLSLKNFKTPWHKTDSKVKLILSSHTFSRRGESRPAMDQGFTASQHQETKRYDRTSMTSSVTAESQTPTRFLFSLGLTTKP